MVARGDQIVVTAGAIVHRGFCLARLDNGEKLFIDGALPEEVVRVRVIFRKKKVWFARVEEVIEKSPDRVIPPCPLFGECGGCHFQHIAYERQLEIKKEIVCDAMRRQAVSMPAKCEIHGMEKPWGYRWRGEFHVIRGKEGMKDAQLGFNRRHTWQAVPVDTCLIHHAAINKALPIMRELVRESGSESLTALHMTVGNDGKELLLRPKPYRSIDQNGIDAKAEVLHNSTWSTSSTELKWKGFTFRITPDTFIQVNWTQMDILYDCVLEMVGDIHEKKIVDAYSGMGIVGTVLAQKAKSVLCIEQGKEAVRMGMLNARINGVSECVTYQLGTVESRLPLVRDDDMDILILDPPRAGCGSAVTGWLALKGPARIVYVSCDPATLARDLHVLATSGPYRIERIDIVDMFPQTYHVESVVSLARNE